SHGFVLFVKTQPAAPPQVSVVHGLLSSQRAGPVTSSTCPLQLSSIPLQTSVAPGWTFGFESSQSHGAAKPSPSASVLSGLLRPGQLSASGSVPTGPSGRRSPSLSGQNSIVPSVKTLK